MHSSRTPATIRILIAVLLLAIPGVSRAQPPVRESTETLWTDPAIATVVLVDALNAPNAAAVVIRRPGELPNNIILVTRSTSPTDLSRAVTALVFSRRNKGDHVAGEMRTFIAPSPRSLAKPTGDEQRAEKDLRRLKTAPEFAIAGIAHGPAIVIRMADSAVERKPRNP